MATPKKTKPEPTTFVKYDDKGKKLDTQKTSNPALRNELLTSGYREEKPNATTSGSGASTTRSGSSAGNGSAAGK